MTTTVRLPVRAVRVIVHLLGDGFTPQGVAELGSLAIIKNRGVGRYTLNRIREWCRINGTELKETIPHTATREKQYSQRQKCLRGEHEAAGEVLPEVHTVTPEWEQLFGRGVGNLVAYFDSQAFDNETTVNFCKHCRCLFVERP